MRPHEAFEKNFEKSEKTFEKGIDKRERMWYNI